MPSTWFMPLAIPSYATCDRNTARTNAAASQFRPTGRIDARNNKVHKTVVDKDTKRLSGISSTFQVLKQTLRKAVRQGEVSSGSESPEPEADSWESLGGATPPLLSGSESTRTQTESGSETLTESTTDGSVSSSSSRKASSRSRRKSRRSRKSLVERGAIGLAHVSGVWY